MRLPHRTHTQTARDIAALLPLTINAKDWKEKAFYGRVKGEISVDETQHNLLQAGDLAYWIDGKSMMFYYDESKNSNITTPVITIGKITSEITVYTVTSDIPQRIEVSS